MKKLPLLVILFACDVLPGQAQNPPVTPAASATSATPGAPAMQGRNPAVPAIVANGFDAYQKTGTQAAMDIWFKGSPLEADASAKGNLFLGISKTETVFGKMLGWDLYKVLSLTPSTTVVYTVLKFEKGPLWIGFYCYRPTTTSDWVVYSLGVDTNPAKVLPPSLFGSS